MLLGIPLDAKAESGKFERVSFNQIIDWHKGNHRAALIAFRKSCSKILRTGKRVGKRSRFSGTNAAWIPVCKKATSGQALRAPQKFFEQGFLPFRIRAASSDTLFTGYFEPEYEGRLKPDNRFNVPILKRPSDLLTFSKGQKQKTGLAYGRKLAGKLIPYLTRKEIEQGALKNKNLEVVWLKSWVDAFFLQIQGSGRINLGHGKYLKLSFAAKNGLPYYAIGATLIKSGEIPRENMSMQSLRAWMDQNPVRARKLMWQNKSYIFFKARPLIDKSEGPIGAQGISLIGFTSLAVDNRFWKYGMPVWLETVLPVTRFSSQRKNFKNLMIAQDTGSAIKGLVRGDIFFGAGEQASAFAGKMNSRGRMTVLLPRAVARQLKLSN